MGGAFPATAAQKAAAPSASCFPNASRENKAYFFKKINVCKYVNLVLTTLLIPFHIVPFVFFPPRSPRG